MALINLPDEILRSICFFADWHDAIHLQYTCHRLNAITSEPLLWKHHCRSSFTHWTRSHNFHARLGDAQFQDWKDLFRSRYGAGVKTARELDGIIASQTARIPKLERIVQLGFDAKDVLDQWCRDGDDAASRKAEDGLARRYWAKIALGCVHRANAVETWAALGRVDRIESGEVVERSLGAFDLFILKDAKGDVDEVSKPGSFWSATKGRDNQWLTESFSQICHTLDAYVDKIRRAYPDIDDRPPQEKASLVADFLLSNYMVAMPEDARYHNIDHNFLGRAISRPGQASLPIIIVIIYCYIVRRLGLRAVPCSFPLHVHAIVQPPVGMDLDGEALAKDTNMPTSTASTANAADEPTLYMDPSRNSSPVSISSLHEKARYLASRLGVTRHDDFLGASTPREMTIRCARNILHSLESRENLTSIPPIDPYSAHYAARWALVLLPTTIQDFRLHLSILMSLFVDRSPYDVGLVERNILPLISQADDAAVQSCREVRATDLNAPAAVKQRLGHAGIGRVRFRIGDVFKHKRLEYTAVVTGWDCQCDAGEEWIARMRVDGLAGGRGQAFYHAFVQNDKSMRYVAEENIDSVLRNHRDGDYAISDTGNGTDLPQQHGAETMAPETFPAEIGRWFRRWDPLEKVFVSNIRDEYPDD